MTWPFENDTSAVEKKLASRSIKADKRRSVFVILTIALAVCLMGTLCFLYSAQQRKTLDGILGQYQAGCGGLAREDIARLTDAGQFEKWGYTADAGTVRYQDSVLSVSFVSPEMIDLMGYGEVTGAYPQSPNELCVEHAFFSYFDIPAEAGQTVTLDLGSGERPYTITGILEAENDSRIFTVWIPEAAIDIDSHAAPYELRFRFAGSQGADPAQLRLEIERFFAEMGILEEQTFYSSNYFDMVDLYLGNGVEIYVMAVLIAMVCAIVIYNIFYISVMGKMREYGRLKVLGTTPKQLKRVVKRERRFLTAIAIPLGLVCAAVIALIAVPGYWPLGDNIRSAVIVSLLTYGTVLIATRKPMAMAGKVSAIEAIRTTAYSQQQGRSVSKQLHRRLTMPRLALMNFSRNRKKAFVTALSLSLTGILLLCISAYANSVDVKEMAQSQFGDRSQYLLQYEDYAGREFVEMQKENPLGQTLRTELAALPGVDYVTAYSLTCVEIPSIGALPGIPEHEPFFIRGISKEDMAELYAGDAVLEGTADYRQLLDENGILVCPAGSTLKEIYRTGYQVGDAVTLSCYNGQAKTYTVMGIVQDVQIGSSTHFFILPEEELPALYPEISDFTGYVNVHTEQDSNQLRRAVFSAVPDQRVAVSGLDDLASELERNLRGELARDYGSQGRYFVMIWPFENDTSAVIQKLASAKLKHNKLQKRVAAFAIMLAAALMSAVLLLTSGIAAVNRDGGNSVTGSYHALISGIGQTEFERLQADGQTVLTGLTVSLGSSKIGGSRLNLSYSNVDALALNGLTVSDGRMPESEQEILIEKEYLDYWKLDAGIGDRISILMPNTQEEREFTISGYLKTAASGTGRSLYAAIVSEQYFVAHGGWDGFSPAAMIRVNAGGASSKAEIETLVTEVLARAGITKIPSFNETYINLSRPSVPLIGAAAAGLAVIIAACILVIYNIFYIAIINSIQEYGQLRTLGMTGRQIKRLVLREGLALSVRSIPAGLGAGTVLSCLLIPQGFRPVSLLWVWPVVTVLVYLTVRLSLRKPALLAASISPIAASRYTGQQIRKNQLARRPEKISPVMLAKKHLATNRKKNVLTVLSLALTGVLLMGFSSVLSSINARDMSLSGFPRGQFILNISNDRLRNAPLEQIQTSSPFTDSLKNSLNMISGLEDITEYHYLPAAFQADAVESELSVVGFDRDDMDLIRPCLSGQTDLDYDSLAEQNLLIVGRPDSLKREYGIQPETGQTLTLKIFDGTSSDYRDFTVGAVLDQSKIGSSGDKIDMLMLPMDVMEQLTSANTLYQLAVRISDGMETQAEVEIDQILNAASGLEMMSLSAAIAQNENFIQGMKLVLAAAVAFIGCFAIMNLIHTILTGVIVRQKEHTLMRCVGMGQNQLCSMVLWESLMTSGIGLVFSMLIGGGVGAALCSRLKNGLMTYLHYRFPVGIALVYGAVVVLSALTVTWAALKHQNKLSLIEQLRVSSGGGV